MKVEELIEKLLEQPLNAEVCVYSSEFQLLVEIVDNVENAAEFHPSTIGNMFDLEEITLCVLLS